MPLIDSGKEMTFTETVIYIISSAIKPITPQEIFRFKEIVN